MKFMKLGSKPDAFRTGDDNTIRYVDMELASDITIIVGNVKFHLHKFPLLSKSAFLQTLVTTTKSRNDDELHVLDNFPGGPTTFEQCAKFCYGMTVTLNAHNVVLTRCAAEYLGMHETIDKGNLVYKIDAFFNSCILRSWKESIIVLQTTKSILPLSDDLNLVTRCISAISSLASIHTSKVDWCYTYNRKKPLQVNEINLDLQNRIVPKDWFVEDLSELEISQFEKVIEGIKNKGLVCNETIGDAIKAYAYKNLPVPTKGVNRFKCKNLSSIRSMIESIVRLIPLERSVSCSFLLKLLKVALLVNSDEMIKGCLIKMIGRQLDEATVADILIEVDPSGEGNTTSYDVEVVQMIIQEFLSQDSKFEIGNEIRDDEVADSGGISSEVSLLLVVKLVDSYLAEVARDQNLSFSTFLAIAEMVSSEARQSHDALYMAIDTYLKEHPEMSKSEKKRICKLIDCKKLSIDVCMHAVQNERLPMRMIIQLLFHEQARAAMASSGASTPDLPNNNNMMMSLHNHSIRSAPPETADWDHVAAMEEIRTLKTELAALGGSGSASGSDVEEKSGESSRVRFEKAVLGKMKGLLMNKKIRLRKIWSTKSLQVGDQFNNGDLMMKRPSFSSNFEEVRATPSRVNTRRISIS